MRATAGTCGQDRPSALEGVLDLLAGLLDVGPGLVAPALGLELLVVGRLAGGFLRLALELVGLVVELVVQTHRRSSWCVVGADQVVLSPNLPRGWVHTTPVRVDRVADVPRHPGRRPRSWKGQGAGSDAGRASSVLASCGRVRSGGRVFSISSARRASMRQMTAQPTIATKMAAVLMRIMASMGVSWDGGGCDENL